MKIRINPKNYPDLLNMSRYLHDFVVWEFKPWIRTQKRFPYIWCGLTRPVSLNLDLPLLNYLCHLYTGEVQEYMPDNIVIDPEVSEVYRHEGTEEYESSVVIN